jgi:hypothetical protein
MRKSHINSLITLTFLLLLNLSTSLGQQCIPKGPALHISVEKYREPDESEIYFIDSLDKKLRLIFEKEFNDSMAIFLDNKKVYDAIIATQKFLGVSLQIVDIDYSKYKRLPAVSIIKNKEPVVYFYPIHGKRIIYLNFFNQNWWLEASNLQRGYR